VDAAGLRAAYQALAAAPPELAPPDVADELEARAKRERAARLDLVAALPHLHKRATPGLGPAEQEYERARRTTHKRREYRRRYDARAAQLRTTRRNEKLALLGLPPSPTKKRT